MQTKFKTFWQLLKTKTLKKNFEHITIFMNRKKLIVTYSIFIVTNSYRVQTDVDQLPGDNYHVTLVATQQTGLVSTHRAAKQNDQNVAVLLRRDGKSLDCVWRSRVNVHAVFVRAHFVLSSCYEKCGSLITAAASDSGDTRITTVGMLHTIVVFRVALPWQLDCSFRYLRVYNFVPLSKQCCVWSAFIQQTNVHRIETCSVIWC